MGDGLIGTAIARPVAVLVGVILVVLFGFLSIQGLPIQLTPDIEVPTLSVQTQWPGAAPAEVEREIIEEQEEVLKDVQGLVRMTSDAENARGTVTLEFEVGTNIDEAMVRVSNRLTQVPSYPLSARQPVINTASGAGPPLAVLLIQSPTGGEVAPYRTWGEQEILPTLERIPGVAGVRYFGGRDTELEILFDPAALAARGLTLERVTAVVQAHLSDISAGDVTLSKQRFLVRTLVTPEVPAELERAVLGVGSDGEVVRLGDVARVRLGLGKRGAFVYGDDRESMALLFDREAGSNVLEVTQRIRDTVAELQETRLDPEGLELRIASDQVAYIEGALRLIRNNLFLGGGLAVLVLLVFLRSVRSSAVVAIAIPVCVIGTALGMSLLGRTVNVVSLAGMAFAVGLVVDNSIVVLEAIDTWRKQGMKPAQAALKGAREVWGAIFASTLTTAAVFIPIIAWQDEVGELLRDVAIAITVAVFLSLAVSVLVIPSFAAKLIGVHVPRAQALSQRVGGRIRAALTTQARWIAGSGLRSLAVTSVAVGVAAVVGVSLLPPMEYLPTGHRNQLFGQLVAPSGYSVEEMTRIGQGLQDQMAAHTGVSRDGVPAIERSFFVARPGGAFMGASAMEDDEIGDLVRWVRERQAEVPGVFGFVGQASLFGRSVGAARAVDVEVTGPEVEALIDLAGPLMGQLREAVPGAQVRPIPSLDAGAPELQVLPRQEAASALGLGSPQVGAFVDALVDGRFIGEFSPRGLAQVDVLLRADPPVVSPAALASAPVATPSGRTVPLSSVADVVESLGPAVIQRIERRRAITLQVSPPDEMALSTAVDRIQRQVLGPLEEQGLPAGVRIELGGAADKLAEAQDRFVGVLLLAVLISFLLMAALFEDFVAPLIILVTVPLAGAGGVVGLRLVDALLSPQTLDMMTAVGFVILIGVVVNNAILVVDGALLRLREGAALADGVAGAVERRVRPIFMSAMTSLAGLTPLVLFPGAGSELYRGVGAVVLGGLALATVLTLFVVPAFFALTWRLLGRAR